MFYPGKDLGAEGDHTDIMMARWILARFNVGPIISETAMLAVSP